MERLLAVPWARRCALDERAYEAGLQAYGLHADPTAWLPNESPSDDTTQDSTWDPEDDQPVYSAEESAVHRVVSEM